MLGFINIYKPREISSAFAVNKFKRKVGVKCGHMGTLDPLASGVLPIGLNQATRLFNYLLDKEKKYIATFDFAYETPSYDLETQPIKYSNFIPTKDEIKAILPDFIGMIEQVPPAFSAKMIDGKRSYKLARKGKAIELAPKKVEITDIKLIEKVSDSAYSFEISCRGGTYIRSLARDIGEKFSCASTMTSLERTASGFFTKENSVELNEFINSDDIEKYLIKPESVLNFPKITLSTKESTRLLHGLKDEYDLSDGLYSIFSVNEFWGVGEIKNKILKMKSFVRDL